MSLPMPSAQVRIAATLVGLLALHGCGGGGGGGGGGGSGLAANPDSYSVVQALGTLNVSAPGVLGNDTGSSLTATVVSNPNCGALTLNSNGTLSYTHTNSSGACATSDSFTYRVNNGSSSSSPTTVTIAIKANSGCAYHAALGQTPLSGSVNGSNPSGTYSLVSNAAKGTVSFTNPQTGAFTYTPINSFQRGADTFTFQVQDGQATSTATYKIVYTPRIMPLGDSITDGVTVGGGNCDGPGTNCPALGERVGYRKHLRDSLVAGGFQIDYVGTLQSGTNAGFLQEDSDHAGHGGCTADELLNGTGAPGCVGSDNLAVWLDAAKPDVVLLHAGTNDLNGAGDESAATANDIGGIIAAINTWEASNWPVTVLLAGIINTDSNQPLQRQDETTSFNSNVYNNVAVPAIGGGGRLVWLNHEAALNQTTDYADDLHPLDSGYQKMANVWLYGLAGSGSAPPATGPVPGSQFPSAIAPGFLPKCP